MDNFLKGCICEPETWVWVTFPLVSTAVCYFCSYHLCCGSPRTFSHAGWEWGQVCSFKKRSDSSEEYAPSNFPKLGRNVSFSRGTWNVWRRLSDPWGQRRTSGYAKAAVMLCVGYCLSVDKGPFRGFDLFTMSLLQSALISRSHFILKQAFKNLLRIS